MDGNKDVPSPHTTTTAVVERDADGVPTVVRMDVRGVYMSTLRSTLANAPAHTLLWRLADGGATEERGWSAPRPQADGTYFVDVNPAWMGTVLDYLAHGIVTAPKMTLGVLEGVRAAADYLGLADLARECEAKGARAQSASAPPPLTVYVFTDDHVLAHCGSFDTFSYTGSNACLSIESPRGQTVRDLKGIVEGLLGSDHGAVDYYGCMHRVNGTVRPAARVDLDNDDLVVDCWGCCGGARRARAIYARRKGQHEAAVHSVSFAMKRRDLQPACHFVLFVKVYDAQQRTLRSCGSIVVAANSCISRALPAMLVIAGLAPDMNVVLYEEVKPTMVIRLDRTFSFGTAEIECGDIVWIRDAEGVRKGDLGQADFEWIETPPHIG